MNNPTEQPDRCTCKHYPNFRALNHQCPIHGDHAEALRRERAEQIHEQRRKADAT